jgi:hypothetical protein
LAEFFERRRQNLLRTDESHVADSFGEEQQVRVAELNSFQHLTARKDPIMQKRKPGNLAPFRRQVVSYANL